MQVMINGGVLALLITELGGSKFAVGAGFMANFLAQGARVLSGRHVDVSDRKRMVISWWLVSSAVFATILIPLLLADRLSSTVAVWLVVAIYFAQQVTKNIGGAAWHPWLADIVPRRLQGRFFGNMRRAFQLTSLTVIVVAGWYLGRDPSPMRFVAILAALAAAGFLRPTVLLRVRRVPPARKGPPERMGPSLLRPLADREFRWFLVFWGAVTFLINVTRPFTVPFLRDDLRFPGSITIYASALLVLGMVVTLKRWGHTADRLGNRLVFFVNTGILSLSFLLLAVIPPYYASQVASIGVAALSFLLTGVGLAGMGIAQIVRLMHSPPSDYRGPYMGLFFVVNGAISAVASASAGFVLDSLPATVILFGGSLNPIRIYFALMAVALMLTAPMVRRLSHIGEGSLGETIKRLRRRSTR
jgi:MFS family permease